MSAFHCGSCAEVLVETLGTHEAMGSPDAQAFASWAQVPIGILAATDGVSLGVEQGGGHRQDDVMDPGGGEGVGRVDLVRGGAIAEIPKVVRAGGRVAGKLVYQQLAPRRGPLLGFRQWRLLEPGQPDPHLHHPRDP